MHTVSSSLHRSLSQYPLIGLNGIKRSGKDTAAAGLPLQYRRLAFASKLKENLKVLDPLLPSGNRISTMIDEMGWERLKADPVDGAEARRLMQVFGTEVIRATFGRDAWVQIIQRRIEAIHSEHPDAPIVATDVRFDSEAEMIRERGGIIVEVRRPSLESRDSHASERPLSPDLIDHTIYNDGTREQLQTALRKLAEQYWA